MLAVQPPPRQIPGPGRGASCRFPTRPLLLLRSPQVSAQSSNSETSAAGDIALAAASQRGSHVDPDDVIKAVKSTTRLQVKSLSDGTALRVTFACMSGPCHHRPCTAAGPAGRARGSSGSSSASGSRRRSKARPSLQRAIAGGGHARTLSRSGVWPRLPGANKRGGQPHGCKLATEASSDGRRRSAHRTSD